MTTRRRVALCWLGLAALVAVGMPGCATPAGDATDERPIWKRIDQPAIAVCGGCHLDVYEEWSRSLHRGAWTNDNVRVATKDFAIESCRPCHSPEPVLPRGLDRRPKYRDYNHEDGVHCLSCHGLDNGVAAARGIEDAPCRPRFEPRLLDANMCYPCHEPTHQAFAEYRTSDAFDTGIRCVDCHMQPTLRGSGETEGHHRTPRQGRSHGPNGGLNEAFVKRALAWRCWIEDRHLKIELRNRCGHKFPGEIPSRSFLVHVSFPGADPIQVLMRKPHKSENRIDNRLKPDETRLLRYALPNGVSSAKVRLLFKPLPLMRIDQAFVLGEWEG